MSVPGQMPVDCLACDHDDEHALEQRRAFRDYHIERHISALELAPGDTAKIHAYVSRLPLPSTYTGVMVQVSKAVSTAVELLDTLPELGT